MQDISNTPSSSLKGAETSKSVKQKRRSTKTPKGKSSKASKDSHGVVKAEQSLVDGSSLQEPMECDDGVSHDNDVASESEQLSISDNGSLAVPGGYSSGNGESSYDEDSTVIECEPTQASGKHTLKVVNKYIKSKVGLDINAIKWLDERSSLDDFQRSEVILRLAIEIRLAINPEYDLENEAAGNEEENNEESDCDARRIFELFKSANRLLPKDRKKLVEFICKSGNVKLLKLICKQEVKDGGGRTGIEQKYSWKGEFTGFETLVELLHYAIEQQCIPEIVLCIAKKVYGSAHILCNGEQYLDDIQVTTMKKGFDYQDSVIKECVRAAIKFDYEDVVLVMLSGDIYQCIRLMKDERFQDEVRFREALDTIEESVADVMSSWVKEERQSLKDEVQGLLAKGIEIDIKQMRKKDLIAELEYRGIKLSEKVKKSKKRLVKKLRGEGEVRIKLRKTVVGALILTLCNYQDKFRGVLKGKKSFKLKISRKVKRQRREEIKELNADSKKSIKDKLLKSIQLLNSSSPFKHWFFRELLQNVVNDKGRLDKLQAVCTAICKEPMKKLLEGPKIHEDVIDVLKRLGADPLVPDKSNVASRGNIPSTQIECLALSSSSTLQKGAPNTLSTVSSSQQLLSLAKKSITPTRLKETQSKDSLDSKAAEKNNKDITMSTQKNRGLGGKVSYNKGNSSHREGGTVESINRGVGMLSAINFQLLDEKEEETRVASRASGSLGKVGKEIIAHPPSLQLLLKANRMMYIEKALDKVILNYNKLSYSGIYKSGSLDQTLDESFCEEEHELHELFKSNCNFIKYEHAVNKLVGNNVKAATKILLDLVNEAVQPAYYAYVLVFFKHIIRQCDVLNTTEENDEIVKKNKDDINAAVHLLKRASLMEPASSFLLGMMKIYDIGKCSQFMAGSWRDDLIHVVNIARDYGIYTIEQYILKCIHPDNGWDYEKCGLGMQKKCDYLKEMGKYSLYEITLSIMSEPHVNANALNDLFQILSKDQFPEALYSYATALLQAKIGNMSKDDIKEAIGCLNRAALAGHRGAEFLFGTLPFSKVSRILTSNKMKRCICRLEDYIYTSDDACIMDKENVDKVAYCLAVEYYKKESDLVQHNKKKAEGILKLRGMHEELDNLKSRVLSFTLDDSSSDSSN